MATHPLIELPHTPNCLVCGRSNPHGLKLSLHVERGTGVVRTTFTPQPHHVGFEGVVHGGLLATVVDEAMVWAATWSGRRFCVCGELTTRFRKGGTVGEPLHVEARVVATRSRLIETTCTLTDPAGAVVAEGWGKYVPLAPERNAEFVATLIDDTATRDAATYLRHPSP